MKITLGTTPHSNWQPLAPMLEALGCATSDPASPEHWYLGDDNPEGPLLLAYTRPERALAVAMEQGSAPSQALQQWTGHAQALVARFKANRRKAVLIDLTAARQDTEAATATLAAHWQLDPAPTDVAVQATGESVDPYFLLIATAAVQQHPQLRPLLAQLEACTLPLTTAEPDPGPTQNMDSLYAGLQTIRQEITKGKEAEKKRLQAERDLEAGRKERQALQATLKQEQITLTKITAERATLENQFSALQTANKDQAASLENVTEENQLLLEQLHLVQEELEARFLQAKDQEQALAAQQAETQMLQRRLHKLRESIENLEQANRTLNGNLAEQKDQLVAATSQQTEWERQFRQSERDGTLALAAANRRIAELSTELNKVTRSRTWRLTSPVTAYSKKSKRAAKEKLEQLKAEIEHSGLFDENWYLEQYQDVAEAGIHPIEHYLRSGAYEGRNPSERFDTSWYLIYYRDVTESGLNPLIHYLRFGQNENRAPRPDAVVSLPAPEAETTAEPQNAQ